MRLVALILFATLLAPAARADFSVRVRVGDDPAWASPSYDDTGWARRALYATPDTAAVLWLRRRVSVGRTEALALDVSAIAAREVYWDGVFIGRAGRVGTDRASERVGPLDAVFRIPDSLAAPGTHLLAVRMSTFRRHPSIRVYVYGMHAGELRRMAAQPSRSAVVPLVFLGGFVLIALYYGVLWGTDRRRLAHGLTALLCLAAAALLVAESWRALVGYPYDLHVVRLRTVAALTCAVGWLLVAVLVAQFRVPRGRRVLGLLAVGIGIALWVPDGYDTQALGVFAVSLATALGVALWARWRRRPGASVAAAGVAGCTLMLLATGYRFLDAGFFASFGVLVGGMLASLGVQARDAQRRHEASLARAARLEADLLRKHLQPHFLMNTLTSVMEYVETDPAVGARALGALADELRTLSDLSGERLVPMARELALCRAHLDVMGFRRDVAFRLDADGVDLDAPIPPAVLHTLVENAATHNAYRGAVTFTLREVHAATSRRLTLRTPLADAPPEPGPERGGLGYARARLEESLPGAWALASGPEGDDWVTRLDLPLPTQP